MMTRQSLWIIVGCILIAIWSSSLTRCADSDASSSTSTDHQVEAHVHSFIERYQLREPGTHKHLDVSTYKAMVRAAQEMLVTSFYHLPHRMHKLRTRGDYLLRKLGQIKTPNDLRRHPNFIDFFDGHSSTPAVFISVADMLPTGGMRDSNPDVAIFMHSVRVSHLTHAQYWLELKQIVRASSEDSDREQVVRSRTASLGTTYLSNMPEPFKWPVLPDLERHVTSRGPSWTKSWCMIKLTRGTSTP